LIFISGKRAPDAKKQDKQFRLSCPSCPSGLNFSPDAGLPARVLPSPFRRVCRFEAYKPRISAPKHFRRPARCAFAS
jgi:hypothetical protein